MLRIFSTCLRKARSPTVHARVEAELAAEQRRARQAIEIAALDAERVERAATIRNRWRSWVNRTPTAILWIIVMFSSIAMYAGTLYRNLSAAPG